ncbi:hypothetical protein FRC07_013466 [Ceratobasidium sp. 392]|nr:hypothetical protein FRC07_013466 [Ceratobasidium sp. 392]
MPEALGKKKMTPKKEPKKNKPRKRELDPFPAQSMPATSMPEEPYWYDKGLYRKPPKGPSRGTGVIRAPHDTVEGAQRPNERGAAMVPDKATDIANRYESYPDVGSNIDAVVRAAKRKGSNSRPILDKGKDDAMEEEIKKRVSEEVQRLKMCPPAPYWGTIAMISTDDMYALIRNGQATPKDFADWLNAWPVKEISNNNMTYLGIDMGEMEITEEGVPSLVPEEREPVEGLEPLTEEIFEGGVNLEVHT